MPEPIEGPLLCRACGYDRRGIADAVACPECGLHYGGFAPWRFHRIDHASRYFRIRERMDVLLADLLFPIVLLPLPLLGDDLSEILIRFLVALFAIGWYVLMQSLAARDVGRRAWFPQLIDLIRGGSSALAARTPATGPLLATPLARHLYFSATLMGSTFIIAYALAGGLRLPGITPPVASMWIISAEVLLLLRAQILLDAVPRILWKALPGQCGKLRISKEENAKIAARLRSRTLLAARVFVLGWPAGLVSLACYFSGEVNGAVILAGIAVIFWTGPVVYSGRLVKRAPI